MKFRRSTASAFAVLAVVSGCGGGGSGTQGGSDVSPPPSAGPAPAPPTPAPAPTPAPPFGALGQTTSQQFALLGYGYRAQEGGVGYSPDPTSFNANVPIGLRFNAPAQLLLTVGGFGEGVLSASGGQGIDAKGRTISLGYRALGGHANLSAVPRGDVEDYLTSTGEGSWVGVLQAGTEFPYLALEFVYGVPTPSEKMPQSGSGVYHSLYSTYQPLTVDFGVRTVSGTITLGPEGSTTVYKLSNVAITGDGTTFKGILRTDGSTAEGSIEGRFTGPAAQELMARFVIPLPTGLSAGVWGAQRR